MVSGMDDAESVPAQASAIFLRKDPMAEAVVVSPAASIERRVSQDRLFYSGMAIVMALAVLAGFAQTYYLPLAGSGQLTTITGREVSALIHAHGALFSLWVLLFVVQTSLIATHRVRIHQRMGLAFE